MPDGCSPRRDPTAVSCAPRWLRECRARLVFLRDGPELAMRCVSGARLRGNTSNRAPVAAGQFAHLLAGVATTRPRAAGDPPRFGADRCFAGSFLTGLRKRSRQFAYRNVSLRGRIRFRWTPAGRTDSPAGAPPTVRGRTHRARWSRSAAARIRSSRSSCCAPRAWNRRSRGSAARR